MPVILIVTNFYIKQLFCKKAYSLNIEKMQEIMWDTELKQDILS